MIDAYGDTSGYGAFAIDLPLLLTYTQPKAYYRTTPTIRVKNGIDFYLNVTTNQLADGWEWIPEEALETYTRLHHCVMTLAYENE